MVLSVTFVQFVLKIIKIKIIAFFPLKGNATLKHIVLQSKELLQFMNFDTNLINIGGELRKIRIIEYFNIDGMGAAILNI